MECSVLLHEKPEDDPCWFWWPRDLFSSPSLRLKIPLAHKSELALGTAQQNNICHSIIFGQYSHCRSSIDVFSLLYSIIVFSFGEHWQNSYPYQKYNNSSLTSQRRASIYVGESGPFRRRSRWTCAVWLERNWTRGTRHWFFVQSPRLGGISWRRPERGVTSGLRSQRVPHTDGALSQ